MKGKWSAPESELRSFDNLPPEPLKYSRLHQPCLQPVSELAVLKFDSWSLTHKTWMLTASPSRRKVTHHTLMLQSKVWWVTLCLIWIITHNKSKQFQCRLLWYILCVWFLGLHFLFQYHILCFPNKNKSVLSLISYLKQVIFSTLVFTTISKPALWLSWDWKLNANT